MARAIVGAALNHSSGHNNSSVRLCVLHVPDKHIWLTAEAEEALRRLARRWGLSDSATIARALQIALTSE